LISTITAGGKKTGVTPTRQILKALKAFFVESFTPFAYNLARRIKADSNFFIIKTLVCH